MGLARESARLTGLSAWRALLSFFNSDNLTYAASIAYYSLLSLFPLSMLGLAVLGSATADAEGRKTVLDFVLRYFPSQFEFIRVQLDALAATTATFGFAGSVFLVWGSLGVFSAISTAVNYAWGVERPRTFWGHKLFTFLMLLVTGLILLAALLLVMASRVVRATWFADAVPTVPVLAVLEGLASRYATTALFIVLVGLIFYFVPNTNKVRFRDVWIGALLTGVLWTGAIEALSWFLRDMTRLSRVNGSVAAAVAFLIWVYTQAVILLYGAEFTACHARLRQEARTGGGGPVIGPRASASARG
jgi:membrane protein